MSRYASLIFITGLAFLLAVIIAQLPLGNNPMPAGRAILQSAVSDTGAANLVTSVVLAYRGLDTLGELAILFTAASIVGLVLHRSASHYHSHRQSEPDFIIVHALDLLYPLLLLTGLYIIVHGHLTPGGGFQGGVIIACAFFLDILARPNPNPQKLKQLHHRMAWIESLSGAAFIVIGLIALLADRAFLQPLLTTGITGHLWSAGTLPLLYLAIGLKVGAELSSLLNQLFYFSHQKQENSSC